MRQAATRVLFRHRRRGRGWRSSAVKRKGDQEDRTIRCVIDTVGTTPSNISLDENVTREEHRSRRPVRGFKKLADENAGSARKKSPPVSA